MCFLFRSKYLHSIRFILRPGRFSSSFSIFKSESREILRLLTIVTLPISPETQDRFDSIVKSENIFSFSVDIFCCLLRLCGIGCDLPQLCVMDLTCQTVWQQNNEHICSSITLLSIYPVQLQTKVIRRYAKILQSQRKPILGPSPGWKRLLGAFSVIVWLRQLIVCTVNSPVPLLKHVLWRMPEKSSSPMMA